MPAQSEGVSPAGAALRLLAAFVLVYGTFNPEGYSYFHWAIRPFFAGTPAFSALKFLAGVVLVIGWVVFIQATRRSLGALGVALAVALLAGITWLLMDVNVLHPRDAKGMTHVVLVAVALILAVGLSWSLFARRVTGQVDTDQVG